MPTHTVRVIARQDLDRWVARLIEYAEVIAPIRAVKGDTLFATVTSPADVLWQFENPLLPPKWVLLPQTETVARIHRRNGHHEVEPPPTPRRRVLLNARSCDTTALALLRHVSEEDPPDESVLRRADALTVVTLLVAQVGGLGSLFNLLVVPDVRAYNRMSPGRGSVGGTAIPEHLPCDHYGSRPQRSCISPLFDARRRH